jgi:outer membrane protein OmpU
LGLLKTEGNLMKKLLLASTALVATAGIAAADVTLSGGARFGIIDTGTETVITNRFTINIDGNTTIDSGAELFARVRIRGGNEAGEDARIAAAVADGPDATSASAVSAPRVGMTSGGMTLAVGNINGALESTPGLYSGAVGLTGLGWGNLPVNNSAAGSWFWDSFSSGGGGANGVEVIYSAGDMGIHVSHSEVSDQTSAHISYAFGDWTAALAMLDDGDGPEATLITLGGSLGSANVGLKYADVDDGADSSDSTTVWASFDVASGTTVTGYFTSIDNDATDDSYGLGFTHSLGGATLAGGVASIDDTTRADLGVRFNF